jgi:hypothetical protein
MSNALTNSLETKSYTLFLQSVDKLAGSTNNKAIFDINYDDFLPRQYDTYKTTFSFQSGGGKYFDSVCACTGTTVLNSTTLSITAKASGNICVGQLITGIGISPDTYISSFVSGTKYGSPSVWTMSKISPISVVGSVITGSAVYSGCKIVLDSMGRSYSFDSSNKGPSLTLGYAQRDIQTTASNSNSFSAFYLQFPPKTISRPSQNLTTISLYNLNYMLPLLDTDTTGSALTDCTNWNIIIEFIPVPTSHLNNAPI